MDNKERNSLLLDKFSIFLNFNSDFITKNMVEKISKKYDLDIETSYRILLAQALELDRELEYDLKKIIKKLDVSKYILNPYYKNINLENISYENWQFKKMSYKPFEAFVYNDLMIEKGKVYPKIGFFDKEYKFPAILQNGRVWMLITPNEIETMQEPINKAFGNVVTYGLGMGYFAYMVSNKINVNKVTIIEKDKNVIELFKKYILPQFKNKKKIQIINEDAIVFAKHLNNVDYVFADIWHDPSDAIEIYKKLKSIELPNIVYDYWIEKTIKYYL